MVDIGPGLKGKHFSGNQKIVLCDSKSLFSLPIAVATLN